MPAEQSAGAPAPKELDAKYLGELATTWTTYGTVWEIQRGGTTYLAIITTKGQIPVLIQEPKEAGK